MSVKIGVFGAFRGMVMIDVLTHWRDADLVAVCDKYEPVLEKVRKKAEDAKMNVALYKDFDEFINHDMDAVILANYATEHATFAVRCLKAGKHVLSECLPCETMAQAVELIEAVEETGKVYAFAENCCYMAAPFEMWKRYEKGELGEVVYAEGEYIHDCAKISPAITYGDKTHWRNRMYPTFYCTHSLGPVMTITGKRPVSVVGYETPVNERNFKEVGEVNGVGIEIVTLDNGAIVKSIHGSLKREEPLHDFQIYCQKGMMESGRFTEKEFNCYKEGENLCEGEWEKYIPEFDIRPDMVEKIKSHGGSDFYAPYFFVQKILGNPDGKWAIDVYTAVDMGICGILAWRSALNGSVPVKIPNLRNKEEREEFRHDNTCTTPEVAGENLIPKTTHTNLVVPEEIYLKLQKLCAEDKDANGNPM